MFDPKIDAYMSAVIDAMPIGRIQVADAFKAIAAETGALTKRSMEAQHYQLLALRRYLRAGGAKLVANWPWTVEEQKTTYKGVITALKQSAIQTKKNFEAANPGLILGYTEARSLARQANLWVDNDSVMHAASKLHRDARGELAASGYLDSPTPEAAKKFSKYLHTYPLSRAEEPSNAAPGLSDHGQMKAVDFYVTKNGKRIADIKTVLIDSQWTATGLGNKLKAATAGTGLIGPLQTPYEPWHYSVPF